VLAVLSQQVAAICNPRLLDFDDPPANHGLAVIEQSETLSEGWAVA
jgi:hypothetical protein